MTYIRNTPPFPKKAPVDAQARCTHRERDDNYAHVIANPSPRWRIIMCRDGVQRIIQKKEASHAGPWRAEGYYTCRESLIKACGKLDLLSDTNTEAVLYALPERITGTAT